MNSKVYKASLIAIAAMGGLLYGYDIGVIGKALPYMGLDESQKGAIASAIMFGVPLAGIIAGAMSDFLGRRRAMLISSLVFIVSVGMIVWSRSFAVLFAGRMLQGLSAGMIAVVLPVYMSESAPTKIRGVTSTMFQMCITIGIALSMLIGYFYQAGVDTKLAGLADGAPLIASVHSEAWRSMFQSSGYPAIAFILVALLAAESPRWLFRHGHKDRARVVLAKIRDAGEVDLEMSEMEDIRLESAKRKDRGGDSLFQARYMVPLLLAVFLMSINQATGICAVLSFIDGIAAETGLAAGLIKQAGIWLTWASVLSTIGGVFMVDVLGRKMLLKLGTGLIILALGVATATYWRTESQRMDARAVVTRSIQDGTLAKPIMEIASEAGLSGITAAQISVQYKVNGKEKEVVMARSDRSASGAATDGILRLNPGGDPGANLEVIRAKISAAPSTATGMTVFLCLIVYIIGFAFGPGVVLWLMSAELMPTRIRSVGMGIGVLGNAVVTAASTTFFLPVIGHWGYAAMFGIWLVFTLVYFLFAAFILPETKGKTLEEIEARFAK